ncbi:MAG: bifunctional heptose 7-phosphate kinase/heptose 1-phosphate adenyltransferase [Terriglobia bacterium]
MNKPEQRRLSRIARQFRGRRIAVLGDFMLDEFLRGEATRISPEAPVPVVLIKDRSQAEGYPGGAGNVAANITALGAAALPLGAIGKDESGNRLLRLLRSRGIKTETLIRERGRLTPRKVRVVAHQHQLLRLDFESTPEINAASAGRLLEIFRRNLKRLDGLLISDYGKGSVTPDLCREMMALARTRALPVFVDPKPERAAICYQATVVTPNLQEAEKMAGAPMRTSRQIQARGQELLEKFACEYLLVTRGAQGMTVLAKDEPPREIESVPRPVYDVTGAGDTVLAVVALAYCSGASMQDAARLANLAGGWVVLKFGTSEISLAELLQAIQQT